MKRLSHKKSRQGCLACKKAHNKCDEQRPRCANCIRLSRHCTWPEPKNDTLKVPSTTRTVRSSGMTSNTRSTPTSAAPSPSSKQISAHDPIGLPLHELRLLHNYMSDSSHTVGEDKYSPIYGLWSQTVVGLGLEYPFLLRAVLSVSALRLAKDESSHDWFMESAVQIEAGLKVFRALIANGDTTSDARLQSALFAFASLLVVQNFGLAVIEAPTEPIEEFIKCLRLVRGVRAVLKNAWEVIQNAELAPLIFGASKVSTPEDAPEDLFLTHLQNKIQASTNLENDDRAALIEAASRLEEIAAQHTTLKSGNSEALASSIAVLLKWATSIPERAVELMAEHEPHALCLMAYFQRLLASSGPHWWLTNWDGILDDAVVRVVPGELGKVLVEGMQQR